MDHLILLAKKAVENYIEEGKIISLPQDFPAEFLEKRAGVFITIEIANNLRACIGTYLPTKINIAQEVVDNAIAAATEDYRFGPIQKEELPHLSYIVYVLGSPEPITSIKELNPEKFGIIVKTGPFVFPDDPASLLQAEKEALLNNKTPCKTGLLLPSLEGVDSPEKQLSIACHKAEIDPEKEKIFIYRFAVKKYCS